MICFSRAGLILITSFVSLFSISRAQWVNGQAASVVIGQSNFLTKNFSTTDNTLYTEGGGDGGVLYDPQHAKLYVFDLSNNRVLRFSYPAGGFSSNQPTAEAVFGQSNFSLNANNTITAQSMSGPTGGDILDDTLWVADESNTRVLGFYNASTKASGSTADVVLGQADFTHATAASSISGMNLPTGVSVDRVTRDLYVADYGNHRVLKFNANNKSTGASANLVFGQNNFTSNASALTATGLNGPWKVLVYKNSLFVADYSNGRVLRYDNLRTITANQPSANIVFGQADFTTKVAGLSASLMTDPAGIAIDSAGRLYTTDYTNNRLLVFPDALTNSNSPSASTVIGQADFASGGNNTTSTQMANPDEITIDNSNKKILVMDANNNRVLQYTASSVLPVELSSFSASINGRSVELIWKTATEVNNYGFEIERKSIPHPEYLSAVSIAGAGSANTAKNEQWMKIRFVEGYGTTNSPQKYFYSDKNLSVGKHLYRLKQIDRDGRFEYSQEVEAEINITPLKFELAQNYPNPFNPATTIEFTLQESGLTKLTIYDVIGRKVATLVNEFLETGVVYQRQFDGSTLASGFYFATLQNGTNVEHIRMSMIK